MMEPEIKAEWIKRLRSGDYVQGINALRDNYDKHCCLGVLCEIAVEREITERWENYAEWPGTYAYGSNDDDSLKTGTMPDEVWKWAGLYDDVGSYKDNYNDVATLTHLNDTGSTFDEIANVIERYF